MKLQSFSSAEIAARDAGQSFSFTNSWTDIPNYGPSDSGATCKLIPGQKYLVEDDGCESHCIQALMTFHKIVRAEIKEDDVFRQLPKEYLLFRDDEKSWWIVTPQLRLDAYAGVMKLVLGGENLYTKNWRKKRELQPAKTMILS